MNATAWERTHWQGNCLYSLAGRQALGHVRPLLLQGKLLLLLLLLLLLVMARAQ